MTMPTCTCPRTETLTTHDPGCPVPGWTPDQDTTAAAELLVWHPAGTDEPGDQYAYAVHAGGPHDGRYEVGPDTEPGPWSLTFIDSQEEVTIGRAYPSEEAAKAAAEADARQAVCPRCGSPAESPDPTCGACPASDREPCMVGNCCHIAEDADALEAHIEAAHPHRCTREAEDGGTCNADFATGPELDAHQHGDHPDEEYSAEVAAHLARLMAGDVPTLPAPPARVPEGEGSTFEAEVTLTLRATGEDDAFDRVQRFLDSLAPRLRAAGVDWEMSGPGAVSEVLGPETIIRRACPGCRGASHDHTCTDTDPDA